MQQENTPVNVNSLRPALQGPSADITCRTRAQSVVLRVVRVSAGLAGSASLLRVECI